MTTNEFISYARNAVAKVMEKQHGVDIDPQSLELVWYAHELGHKKCTLYGKAMGLFYAEVTFNFYTENMYVDIYEKKSNNLLVPPDYSYEFAGDEEDERV